MGMVVGAEGAGGGLNTGGAGEAALPGAPAVPRVSAPGNSIIGGDPDGLPCISINGGRLKRDS